jgi:hypothetical protein
LTAAVKLEKTVQHPTNTNTSLLMRQSEFRDTGSVAGQLAHKQLHIQSSEATLHLTYFDKML